MSISRYILLTDFQNYHAIVTKRRTCCVQGLALFVSTLVPTVRHVNTKWFYPIHFTMCILPDIVLPAMYFLIVRSMHRGRKHLEKHVDGESTNQKPMKTNSTNQKPVEMGSTNQKPVEKKSIKQKLVKKISINQKGVKRMSTKTKISRRNDEVTRRVTLIVAVYSICSIVTTICMLLQVAGKVFGWDKDLLSRFCFLGLAANSCWNPVIYVVGDRVFRRKLKRLFCFCVVKANRQKSIKFEGKK